MKIEMPATGHYVVIFRLRAATVLTIGALGEIAFEAGYYAYVGSALRNLPARVRRHLNPPAPRLRWHVDYLARATEPVAAVSAFATDGKECPVAESLRGRFAHVARFGAGDCRCPSHLFHHPDGAPLVSAAMEAFRDAGRSPVIMQKADLGGEGSLLKNGASTDIR